MIIRTMKHRIILLVLLAFFASNSYSISQDVKAKASLDTNNVLIGDQVNLILEFESDTAQKVVWPQIPDTLGAIEILSRDSVTSLLNGNRVTRSQKILITSFDSGAHSIAPFTFMYDKPGYSTMYPEESNPLLLNVNTVAVDTTEAIKDIKPPLDEPIAWTEYLIYFLIAIAAAALIIGIIYYLKKRKRKAKEEVLDYDPRIPTHILALQSLKDLENEKLWHKGMVKQYYIKLTEIIRLYIKRQFRIDAMEMITPEIIDNLEKHRFENELIQSMKTLFELADLVKFAKYQPIPDENSKSMTMAYDFVERTKPLERPEETKKEESKDE
jgi:hypothetical protein